MKFNKLPIKGTNDFLPEYVRLRKYVMNIIKEAYEKCGFTQIETPAMERIENLTGKQGGENEKLIFKILKRGETLTKALSDESQTLCDSGLRYDLTVPLARYYANNSNKLPSPFKALQIGNVWRADNPQKGRFRQFTQCDIDILGDNSILAEIDVISATANMLKMIFRDANINCFTININDRRVLKAMASYSGFKEEDFDTVFIILDKYDKIGLEGVRSELINAGFPPEAINKYTQLFEERSGADSCEEFCRVLIDGYLDPEIVSNIDNLIKVVKPTVSSHFKIVFDPTLVRGMSYYTGTIFECVIDGYGFSIAGGGRYDNMIGKFSGQPISACGFSIGFERIIIILKDEQIPYKESNLEKIAILVGEKTPVEELEEIFQNAKIERKKGTVVNILPLKKNQKRQIEMLMAEGYTEFTKVYDL